ncbi:MAG: ATP-binding protein [Bdellovibrionota bacterium]
MDHSQHLNHPAQTLGSLFSTEGFMPHGHCYLWKPHLVWLHFSTDTIIGLAYVSISLSLYALVRKIKLPFSGMFLAFGAFIGFCGLTHFMEVWTLWNPDYWWSGVIKAFTAAASIATAIMMFPIKPKIIELTNTARLSELRRIQLETANKELEVLNTKLKDIDELRTQFFANISHELRTPLALILGPTESVLASAQLSPHEKKSLETVNRNARTLLKHVNDLLDVSKLEAGKMSLRYSRIDLAKLVKITVAHFEDVMKMRQITLKLGTPDTLLGIVDAEKLQRILMNLLSNAIKYVPTGGVVRCSLEQTQNNVIFKIEDSGPGVRPEHRKIIFERFRQADQGSTRKVGGTGLGLSIVKEFSELHGGNVSVDNSKLGGACFIVELPLKPAEKVSLESADSELEPGQLIVGTLAELQTSLTQSLASASPYIAERPSILVCEDNPEMSRFVDETLSSDFNVFLASNGKEGFAKALALHPDLIMTDIMMPEMSGDELVSQVRAHQELDKIPIMLLSAKADDALRIKLLKNGAQEYLVKPFSREELKTRAKNLIEMKRVRELLEREIAVRSENIETLAKEVTLKKHELELALETAQVAREHAEKASLVKSNFLNLVSHELKTPLTTVNMSLDVIDKHRAEVVSPEFSKFIERAQRSSKALADLVDGLLEYTRVESGQIPMTPEEVNLARLVQETSQDFDAQAKSKNLELKVRIAPELPALISDTRLVRLILSNLVANAIKFTQKGWIEIRITHELGAHVISVSDTGQGIRAEDQYRIFEPFEQLEPIRRKNTPGVGLGLTLVNQMVEALNGKIDLHSEVGVGTTFRILLPALKTDRQAFLMRSNTV